MAGSLVCQGEENSVPLGPEKFNYKSVRSMLIDLDLKIPSVKVKKRDEAAATKDAKF